MVTWNRDGQSTFTVRIRLPRRSATHRAQSAALLLFVAALLSAVYGNSLLRRGVEISVRDETRDLAAGAPFLGVAFFIWLFAELLGNWQEIKTWLNGHDHLRRMVWRLRILPLLAALAGLSKFVEAMSASPETVLGLLEDAASWLALAAVGLAAIEAWRWHMRRRVVEGTASRLRERVKELASAPAELISAERLGRLFPQGAISIARVALFGLAAFSSGIVWVSAADNVFLPSTITLWLVSAILWALTFAPAKWNLFLWLHSRITSDIRIPWRKWWWAYIAFAVIMIMGMSFRLQDLDSLPPQFHNDPYLNLLDAYDFAQGTETPVFFTYNNGRPVFTMYLMAALATAPGLNFDRYTMQLATALASIAALPLMFFLGVAFVGSEGRKAGAALGLLLSGLVAASGWDALLARTGATYALTPFFAALLGIFLLRALRHNRRADYILAGLALGFSLYTYHSARIFPVAATVAVFIAFALRGGWRARLVCAQNFVVLAVVAFMVFLPMFRYMLDDPYHFWRRMEQTWVVEVESGPEEQGAVARETAMRIMTSIRRHLLMYNWQSSGQWGRGLPYAPALDMYSGALLLLGLAALAARMLRARDPVVWALPAILVLMHMPSLLAIDEATMAWDSPSNGRVLAALPFIFLISSLALARIARQILRVFPKPIALPLIFLLGGALVTLANHQNRSLYFDQYRQLLLKISVPTSDGGKIIRGFVDSGGAANNAFIIFGGDTGEPRFIAAEAGIFYYPNGIYRHDDIPNRLLEALGRADSPLLPNRDLLFLYSPLYQEALDELRRLFPNGILSVIPSSAEAGHFYAAYRVPALGEAGFRAWLDSIARG